jgi:hypothetical protein
MLIDKDGRVAGPEEATAPAGVGWRDRSRSAEERVADLLDRMTLEEKVAQLYSVWMVTEAGADGDLAPFQHELVEDLDWPKLILSGLGQLTRPFGSGPVDAAVGATRLARMQAEIAAAGRFGIPALVHEECLSGFTTWGATIYPTPLAWVRVSTRRWWRRWPPRSAGRCATSACTRDSHRCSTSPATRAGDAPRRRSGRTRTWSARSARRTCAVCSRPVWSRR